MAITAIGESQSFSYTGTIQEFEVPATGLYQLEVWGARGGSVNYKGEWVVNNTGYGGYSKGYTVLEKGEILYIVCGGEPNKNCSANAGTTVTQAGGYNGGGSGNMGKPSSGTAYYTTAGGGATHIAKVSGLLKDIGYESFVTEGNGLIVAGGASGLYYTAGWFADTNYNWAIRIGRQGDAGGGLTCGDGPITQTYGYAFGQGQAYAISSAGAGGGGLYGGTSGHGGSGYIDNVPELVYQNVIYTPETSKGVNTTGNGYAIITFVAGDLSGGNLLFFGDILPTALYLGDYNVSMVCLGDATAGSFGKPVTYVVDSESYTLYMAKGANLLNPYGITVPEIEGQTFVGWSLTEDGSVVEELTMGTEAITLYAIYTTKSYVIQNRTLVEGNYTNKEVTYSNNLHTVVLSGCGAQGIVYTSGEGKVSGTITFQTNGAKTIDVRATIFGSDWGVKYAIGVVGYDESGKGTSLYSVSDHTKTSGGENIPFNITRDVSQYEKIVVTTYAKFDTFDGYTVHVGAHIENIYCTHVV